MLRTTGCSANINNLYNQIQANIEPRCALEWLDQLKRKKVRVFNTDYGLNLSYDMQEKSENVALNK